MTARLPAVYQPPRRNAGKGGMIAAGIAIGVIWLAVRPGSPPHAPAHTAAVTSGSETAYFTGVLADLGAPATSANLASLAGWASREGPWGTVGQWNPLDTTLPMPGSRAFNALGGGVGVQSYPTATEGAQATAVTLEHGYPLIVSALRSGAGLCGSGLAGEFLTWSGGGYPGVC